ncbi:Protocadherin-15 [Liparis tanakae]|uniref:Protocadherin-15 n=1 Tax=Liparis tanakae TaxID=230148 RepID=A0A4Z2E6G9_9TELE|nr:Protocadherin-15 [Liparis tanakae]
MILHSSVFLPQLAAVDSDAGPNGLVTYRILAGDQGHFLIGKR